MAGSSAETAARRPVATSARGRMWGWVIMAAVGVYLVFAPVYLLESFLRTLGGVFMFATLALGWNIIGGFAGYPSFGNVVFFGLGGYTVAVLMAKLGWSFWPALVVAVILGMAFAVLIGMPVLRLRGHYFAIATLGVAEGVREIVVNVPAVTGGGAGITIPALGTEATTAYPGNIGFYYFFLALLAGALGVMWGVSRSRFGFALRAIRQDEEGAAAMGINTTRAKITAFAVSALLTSAAGALYAFQQVTIYPSRLFSVEITVLMVVMAVIGGIGTVLGPLIGAVVLQFLSEFLRQNYLDWNLFIFGAIIMVGVIFLPRGVVSAVRETRRRGRLSLLENVRRNRL